MHLVLVARSGAKAAWALPQLANVESAHPALVSIELGTNDVGFKTPLQTFATEYDTIVRQVSAIPGVRVMCVGSWLPSAAVDQVISDSCSRYGGDFVSLQGYYFVDAFHARAGSATFRGRADWFHPGAQGHAAIAAAILAAIPTSATEGERRATDARMNVW
jgi:lysophospholipase L1-like esterase